MRLSLRLNFSHHERERYAEDKKVRRGRERERGDKEFISFLFLYYFLFLSLIFFVKNHFHNFDF